MNPRNEILKLLLESGITKDLGDMDMINRIVTAFEPIIVECKELREAKVEAERYKSRVHVMTDSIRQLLEGREVYEWMDEK